MKISIVFFSQSGNTRKVANALAEQFTKEGHSVSCCTLKEVNTGVLIESDCIGIGSPTFESHAPVLVKDFIKSLPFLGGKRGFVFATGSGAAGSVISDMATLMKRKEVSVIGSFLTAGEMYHPAPCIIGKAKNRPNAQDLQKAKSFASTLSQHLKSGSKERSYNGLQPRWGVYTIVGKICSFESLIRLLVPKPKLDKRRCVRCGRCKKECPVNNIDMITTPLLKEKCIRCYRCLNVCKNSSYSVNWWLGNLVVGAFWNRFFMKWFGEYEGEL